MFRTESLRRSIPSRLAAVAAAILALSFAADAVYASPPTNGSATLRVMLHPAAAPQGQLPDAARQRLEALLGTPFAVAGTTRTGALDLVLAGAPDQAAVDALAKRLRVDRNVLWAEPASRRATAKSAKAFRTEAAPAHRLMLRLADGVDEDAAVARLSALAGTPVAVERRIGNVQVVALAQPRPVAALADLARAFEADPAVRYADPVRRVYAHAGPTPNDPLFGEQWSLLDIRASDAWALGTGSSSVTVAVVDTGILPHPDLVGRVLPGHDFIADADRARDGNGRDPDPRDEGDWTNDGDCGGAFPRPSSWHGLFVAGMIGANSNNATGIAGVDWAARILPVRVLGQCGGTDEDVLAGVLWASGVRVQDAPVNTNPAKVINLSLGGFGACPAAMQEAIDDALAQGTVIVASAGNESDDASSFSPGSCSGIINVAALGRTGDRASYTNYGPRVDIAAPGGDIDADGAIVSTSNQGTTIPADPGYDLAMGTSMSAPLVSGTVSLMLARNPNLTAGHVLSILQGTAANFRAGTSCIVGFCGAGALDTGAALASTIPASLNLPAGAVAIVEYYDPILDHYFITASAEEIAAIDAAGYWQRTGHVFYGWADPLAAPAGTNPQSVCRFYAGPQVQIDSFYFTADPARCAFVMATGGPWVLETSAAFWIEVPDAAGGCRGGTVPVYAFFNNRRDANHRYTIDRSVRRAMTNRAWVSDGVGPNGVSFCSLI